MEGKRIVKVWFDGSCTPVNPCGKMGFGALITTDGYTKEIYGGIDAQEDNSSNVAEYLGLGAAIKHLIEQDFQNHKILVFGDSKLVINQMNDVWRIKNGRYTSEAKKCKQLLGFFSDISFTWIPREENELADELSNRYWNENSSEKDALFEHFVDVPACLIDYRPTLNINSPMPVGKYKGTPIKEVPKSYLRYILDMGYSSKEVLEFLRQNEHILKNN